MSQNIPTEGSHSDKLRTAIYALLLRRLGYKRVPTPVPLVYIAKCTHSTINKVRYGLQRLEKEGYIEKWTTKHNTHFKITYYRIPYIIKEIKSEKSQPPLNTY